MIIDPRDPTVVSVVGAVLSLKQDRTNEYDFGPWTLLIGEGIVSLLSKPYHPGKSSSIRLKQRLLEIGGIVSIEYDASLPPEGMKLGIPPFAGG